LGAARSGEHVPQWKGLATAATAFSTIHDVLLAQAGITGPLHAFEGPLGLRQVLGKDFRIDWTGQGYDGVLACSIKRYNAEFHAQSFLEGLSELRTVHDLRADQVRSVEIEIFKPGYEMIGGGKYVNPRTVSTKEDADHSLPYLAAVMLLDGDVQPEQFEPARVTAPDVQDLMTRIHSSLNRRFTHEYPLWLRVAIKVDRFDAPPLAIEKCDYVGFFRRPMPWPALIAKFKRLGRNVAAADRVVQIVDCVREIEHRPTSDLISILAHASAILA
jgi:2-methylcitrate dehydratase